MAPKSGPSLHGHAGLPAAVAVVQGAVAPLAAVWAQLTPSQRQGLLAHSPSLAALVALMAPLSDMGA